MKKNWSVIIISDDPYNTSHMTFVANSAVKEGSDTLIVDGIKFKFSESIENLEEC